MKNLIFSIYICTGIYGSGAGRTGQVSCVAMHAYMCMNIIFMNFGCTCMHGNSFMNIRTARAATRVPVGNDSACTGRPNIHFGNVNAYTKYMKLAMCAIKMIARKLRAAVNHSDSGRSATTATCLPRRGSSSLVRPSTCAKQGEAKEGGRKREKRSLGQEGERSAHAVNTLPWSHRGASPPTG